MFDSMHVGYYHLSEKFVFLIFQLFGGGMFGILGRPASTAILASQPPNDWWWCLTVTHCMLRGEGRRDPSSCFSWRLEEDQLQLLSFI